ncbi:hypothetical protein Tco_0206728 [Tanacetum coccineum]
MGKYTHQQLKHKNFEEVQKLYEREKKWIDDFKPIDYDSQKQAESTKKRPRADSEEESSKKQKLEEDNDAEKEELRDSMDVVPRDDVAIDVESLATKYQIVDWKIHILNENMMHYQIIRANGSSKNYKIFSEMLDDFDGQDVIDLHRLVNERYETTSPEGYDLLLWGDLKTLFEPNEEDEIWKNQHDYNLISWRLFDSCGVHVLLMNTGVAIHMMIEKKYPLTQEMLSRMLNQRLEVDYESEMAFELLRFTITTSEVEELALDLSKDTKPYIKLRSSRSVHWDQQVMEAGTTSTTLTAKLPILNPWDYDIWLMRIEQYFLMTDYSLWEDRRNEMKARGTLFMALPYKDQLKFHSYKDAKFLMEAIEKRYEGNKESKKRPSSTSQNPQNVAFVSSNSTNNNSSTNEADNTAYGVSAAHTQSNPASGDNLKQIDPDDLEEMDLQWEMAMLIISDGIRDVTDLGVTKLVEESSYNFALINAFYHPLPWKKFLLSSQILRNWEKAEKRVSELKLTLEKFQNSSKSLNNLLESPVSVKFKTGLGYNAASSTLTSPVVERNFIPFKLDITFMDEIVESENMDVTTVVTPSNVKKVKSNHESADVKNNCDAVEPKIIRKNSFRPPVIED